MDSLLSIAQMPPGIPVACVGIDNGKNAALLALQILGITDKEIETKLLRYREKMSK
jgi:5-(carboxyamino)imidazole ribonucleotide mutase